MNSTNNEYEYDTSENTTTEYDSNSSFSSSSPSSSSSSSTNSSINENQSKPKKKFTKIHVIISLLLLFLIILACILCFIMFFSRNNPKIISTYGIPNGLKYKYREYDFDENMGMSEMIDGTLYLEGRMDDEQMFFKSSAGQKMMYIYDDDWGTSTNGIEMLTGGMNSKYDCTADCVCENNADDGYGRRLAIVGYPIFQTIMALSVFAATTIFLNQAEDGCKSNGNGDSCTVEIDSEECIERKKNYGQNWVCVSDCYKYESDGEVGKLPFDGFLYQGFHETRIEAAAMCKIETEKHCRTTLLHGKDPTTQIPDFKVVDADCWDENEYGELKARFNSMKNPNK